MNVKMDGNLSRRDGYVPLLESNGYTVKKLLGIGAFGHVYECMKLDTTDTVAIKVIPRYQAEFGQEEVHNHEQLRAFDPDLNNFIRFNRHFGLSGHVFLEFERLDMTVLDLFESSVRPFHLSEIQVITQQILVALNILRSLGMIHRDIKLDNIMLINHRLHPLRVKLIDFGLACKVKELSIGEILYIPEHRAPEVYLGLPLNEAVDMWALGCVMVSMYINNNLFSGKCELGTMEEIVQLLGHPDDHLLNTGVYTRKYFYKDKDSWKMKTECSCSTGNSSLSSVSSSEMTPVHEPLNSISSKSFSSLSDIVLTRPGTAGCEDTQTFIIFLTEILQVDPRKRINSSEALSHPFFTMKQFPSEFVNSRSSDHGKNATTANEKPAPTSRSDTAATLIDRTAAIKDNRPKSLCVLANMDDDALDEISLTSSHDSDVDKSSNEERSRGPRGKVKSNFFKRIHTFVSRLFKKGASSSHTGGSVDQEEKFAPSIDKPQPTAIIDEAITLCTNNELIGMAETAASGTGNGSQEKKYADDFMVDNTSLATVSLVSDDSKMSTDDATTTSRVRAKKRFFDRIQRLVSKLFNRVDSTEMVSNSLDCAETAATSAALLPSSTGTMEEAIVICTNSGINASPSPVALKSRAGTPV